jgi:protein TonB
MSYVEQSRRRNPLAVAAAIGTQLAIGYALLSGLAYRIVTTPSPPTIVDFPTDPTPPKPLPPERQTKDRPAQQQQQREITTQRPVEDLGQKPLVNPFPPDSGPTVGGGGEGPVEPPQPPRPNLSRDAVPSPDRLRWITTEDYPAAALRANMQGVVVIAATIGTDGKVRSCLVTQSSGSQLLDDATCRLYTRRAHFTPARDADGNPTTAQRIDRYRWQIPNE